jgi:hypothetical protein
MDIALQEKLIDALTSNEKLVEALKSDWGGSLATNGIKVWLADELAAESRHFWCGFRGKMGAFLSRRRELVAEGKLDEREFILDLIAFDSNELRPSVGAEIEQSYARKRDRYSEKERVFSRAVPDSLLDEQKDAEFYYDFSRLLTVAPGLGVFIGLSYDYEGSLARWNEAFDKLLAASRVDTIEEIAVMFILTEPRQNRLNVAACGWRQGEEPRLRSLGKIRLD